MTMTGDASSLLDRNISGERSTAEPAASAPVSIQCANPAAKEPESYTFRAPQASDDF